MKKIALLKSALLACMVLAVSGCGGGSSSTTTSTSTSFPLQSGLKAFVQQGTSGDFSVSGTCSGSAVLSFSSPATATFMSMPAVSVFSSASFSLPNCNPSYFYSFSNDYFDSNYNWLGTVDQSGNYGLFSSLPNIPVSVKVGDSGAIGTLEFKDPTLTFPTGHDDLSYTVLPDTADTAIINMITKSYDVSGSLVATEQDKYRIKTDGTMSFVSVDILLSNGSTTHFVLTPIPDTVPPTVTMTSPMNFATSVPVYSAINATFSEAMDPTTVNSASFTLMNGTTPVPGAVTYNGGTATLTPSMPLTPSTIYTAKITSSVKDLAGNAMSSVYTWQFQTAAPDTIPPTVISTSPASNATAIAVNSTLSATFSEPLDPATITAVEFTLTDGTTAVAGTVTYSGTTATFTPAVALATNTLYTATLTTGVQDLSGNAMVANYSWSFRTFVPAIPTVSSTGPVPYAYAVPLGSAITAVFSTAMDPVTLTSTTFTLLEGTTPVSGSVAYSGNTATFTPLAPLTLNTVYTATLTTGVTDLAGTALSADHSWTFQTFADGSTTGPVDPPPAGLWQPALGVTPATGNFVYLESELGDYIGAGQTYTYTPATAVLSVSELNGLLSVSVNGNDLWNGFFKGMNTLAQLQPGFYPGLQRYPFHNPVFGGVAWWGNGRGCNTLKGWFAVDNIVYDANGVLTAVDLRFEQNCEGGTTALHGAIHWGP